MLAWLVAVPWFAAAQVAGTAQASAQVQDTLEAAGLTVYRDFIRQSEKGGYELIVKGNEVFRGKDPVEILERLPLLRKDAGSLVMEGKSGFKVYIGNREVRLSGSSLMDYLRTVPSSSIRSIEVSTMPSSAYDAEGDVGIVNILTDKNINPGWKGNASLSLAKAPIRHIGGLLYRLQGRAAVVRRKPVPR